MSSGIQKILLVFHLHQIGLIQIFILIPKCSDKKFDYFKRWNFASVLKSNGVWSSRTYSHKSRGKSMDAINIEKSKIYLKHETRGKCWNTSGWTYDNFSWLGQETNRTGLFQVMDIVWENFHEYFLCHSFYSFNRDMTKIVMN